MNNIELYKLCLSSVRKQGVGTLTPETFVDWVNRAQTIVVGNKLAGMDANYRHRDDLRPLLVTDEPLEVTGNTAPLPPGYLRFMDISVSIVVSNRIYAPECIYQSPSRKSKVQRNVYDRPSTRKVYYTIDSEGIKFNIPAGASLSGEMSYYKEPQKIVVDRDTLAEQTLVWNENMINEIVESFTKLYMAHIGDSRLQHSLAVQQQTNNKV